MLYYRRGKELREKTKTRKPDEVTRKLQSKAKSEKRKQKEKSVK